MPDRLTFRFFWSGFRFLVVMACQSIGVFAEGLQAYSLKSDRNEIFLGEPIYLMIGSAFAMPPALEEGTLSLSIRGPESEEWDYHPPLRYRVKSETTRLPNPENSERKSMPTVRIRFARVIAAEGGLVFRKPGRYRLQLMSPRPVGDTAFRQRLSDSLLIQIRMPTRQADRRAYALLSRNPAEYGLAVYLEGGRQLESGMAIISELAGFPNAYRQLARFVLASDWSQDYTDYRAGASRPLNLDSALNFADLSLSPVRYLPLRTAYRLKLASGIHASRDPLSDLPGKILGKLAEFEARLNPRDSALLQSF